MDFNHIEGVYFDCWDTIISFHLLNKAWNYQTLKDHCVNKDQIDWDKVDRFCEDFYEKYYTSHLEYEVKVDQVLNLMVLYFDMVLDCPISQCEHEILIHLDPKPIEGIEKMFAFLKEEGIPCAVLSNTVYTNEDTKALIDKIVPSNCLSYLLASSEVGVKKPNPLFFQCGVRHTHRDISNCIYIGDKFLQDAYGSYKAGFGLSVWLNWKKKDLSAMDFVKEHAPDYKEATYLEVSSYDELIAYLKERKQ